MEELLFESLGFWLPLPGNPFLDYPTTLNEAAADRIALEWENWRDDLYLGVLASINEGPIGVWNIKYWNCVIFGKTKTGWEQGKYKLGITFPDDFPNTPPTCVFHTKIYHPNVENDGTIHIPILDKEKEWVPTLSVMDILLAIRQALHEPCMESAIANEGTALYKKSKKKYKTQAKLTARHVAK